jgi:hypothetical protein
VLAGRMKLKHFLLLAAVAIGLGIFGLVKACENTRDDAVPPPPRTADVAPVPEVPAPTPTPSVDGEPPVATPSDLAKRPYDDEVIAWSRRSIKGDKMKDATKGKPYKVNLYKDAGKTTVNRAKVDLDRDDKFDEKYTFDTTKITLQRAPADDENYTETYHWNGSGWTRE